MRSLLTWITLLHVLHLPVPFPDLDGECRGTPIESLCEAHAWQVLLIGVEPSDDLDRGPLRTSGDLPKQSSSSSPWGDVAITSRTVAAVTDLTVTFGHRWFDLTLDCDASTRVGSQGDAISAREPTEPLSHEVLSHLCRWQV